MDGERVLTSREALASRRRPDRLVVVGAGAVGVEFAYVYAMYGAKVTVLEMAPQMLPGADPELAEVLQREFRRKGIEVRLGTRFVGVEKTATGVRVAVANEKGAEALEADQLLVAIGRRPLSADLGLEAAGVNLTSRGFVEVDARGRTEASGNSRRTGHRVRQDAHATDLDLDAIPPGASGPTPAGVPVSTRAPGRSVITDEALRAKLGIGAGD